MAGAAGPPCRCHAWGCKEPVATAIHPLFRRMVNAEPANTLFLAGKARARDEPLHCTGESPMKIDVTDRESIEHGRVMREAYVLISIRDPDRPPVHPRRSPLCRAVLELAFHDAEPVPGFTPMRPLTYMSHDDALAIWRFLHEHQGKYEAILVQCEQGMSRSPAVAAAVARCLGLDAAPFWCEYQPNRFVYELVCEAAAETD